MVMDMLHLQLVEKVTGELKTMRENCVLIWECYSLNVEDVAKYFGIGQSRLRSIIHENPNADFLLMVGNEYLIKRKKFEAYLDTSSAV